ncbi:hypothetical protein HBB16_16885 [Pseudonocardia sp. MCCB 268]|nr:hypothetical protein [Pseudonocardia cytotoxica]
MTMVRTRKRALPRSTGGGAGRAHRGPGGDLGDDGDAPVVLTSSRRRSQTPARARTRHRPPRPPPTRAHTRRVVVALHLHRRRSSAGALARHSMFGNRRPAGLAPVRPEPGHNKENTRTPDAVTVADGAMTIQATGTARPAR